MRRLFSLLCPLFLLWNASLARQDIAVCGSHPERWKEELHLHRQSERLRRAMGVAAEGAAGPRQARAAARDIGQIAVLEDSDGVVARRNEFNLHGRNLAFLPAAAQAARYRFQVSEGNYDALAASAGTLLGGLGDDDTRRVSLPFPFPFFGRAYDSLYVNSDGNLTFNEGDVSISERSLGRMTAGPPRIAGLFRDLDPSQSREGVRVLAQTSQFVVSWTAVPEYRSIGTGPLQTFQIRLFPDGRIEFAFGEITTRSAIVGIAPGGLLGSSAVVSFRDGSTEEFSSAVAERFTGVEEIDIVLAAQKFYETHEDAYDYLVLFNNLGVEASPGAVAFEVTVRNNRSGYGDPPVDIGRQFGSARRLQAVMNMGPLSQYPADPNAVVPARGPAGDTPLTVLGHEAGHLFLAFASVREANDPEARPMLGRQGAHWSFMFNSEASLLEGNRICDRQMENCPGPAVPQRFITTATVEGYAPLDQYLMGFRAPEEVPPTFLVTGASIGTTSRMPQAGVSFNGQRRDVRVEEVIAAEGRRTPDHTVSQRRFRFAFILVVAKGSEPGAAQLAQLDRYRAEFEAFFRRAAGERSWADTALRRSLRLSTFPAAGVLEGGTMTASVGLERPAAAALTVLLSQQTGAISVPSSVTIPAGATSATFTIRGVRQGVDELVAEAAGDLHERAVSKIQVVGAAGSVRLAAVSGDKQAATSGVALPEPVVLRVTDINNLPYPGARVSAAVSAGGTVEPRVAVADDEGVVRFRWTPGPDPLNELRASLEGVPGGPALTVTALGRPFFTAGSVVNAASFEPRISPGSLATVFGVNLTAGVTAAARWPLTDRLGGVQVSLNGTAALLLYVSERQINFTVPAGLLPGMAQMAVSTPPGSSTPVQVSVLAHAPGIFVHGATNTGAVLVAGTGRTTAERPAAPGEVLEIYGTGLGAVRASIDYPGLTETMSVPQVLLASRAATVMFSGLAPGFIGLYQVNARVPETVPSGLQPLSLVQAGVPSNTVQVRIR